MKIWRGVCTCGPKKYMWSIHKREQSSLGHCESRWARPICVLHSCNLPTSPRTAIPFAMHTRASSQNCPTTPYKQPPIAFHPPACCSFHLFKSHANGYLPPPAAHELHSRGTLPPNLSPSVCLVSVQPSLGSRPCLNAGNIKNRLKKLWTPTAADFACGSRNHSSLMPKIPQIVTRNGPCNPYSRMRWSAGMSLYVALIGPLPDGGVLGGGLQG